MMEQSRDNKQKVEQDLRQSLQTLNIGWYPNKLPDDFSSLILEGCREFKELLEDYLSLFNGTTDQSIPEGQSARRVVRKWESDRHEHEIYCLKSTLKQWSEGFADALNHFYFRIKVRFNNDAKLNDIYIILPNKDVIDCPRKKTAPLVQKTEELFERYWNLSAIIDDIYFGDEGTRPYNCSASMNHRALQQGLELLYWKEPQYDYTSKPIKEISITCLDIASRELGLDREATYLEIAADWLGVSHDQLSESMLEETFGQHWKPIVLYKVTFDRADDLSSIRFNSELK